MFYWCMSLVCLGKASFGDKEWYFFSPRDRKYPNGSRPNRLAGSGYWKATGTDKFISSEGKTVGIKKALVFYIGKAPRGSKTNWIMHEYRLFEPQRRTRSSRVRIPHLCLPLHANLTLVILCYITSHSCIILFFPAIICIW